MTKHIWTRAAVVSASARAMVTVIVGLVVALTIAHPAAAQTRRDAANVERHADDDTAKVITINREVFHYSADGRRDPFVSLTTSDQIRPALTDLRLTTIAFDPTGKNSVAILRDLTTKEQYRLKVGSPIGRMRVVRIEPKSVTFAIEEFGFSRQATLAINDSTGTSSNLRTP